MYRQLFWPVLAPSMLFSTGAGATVPVMVLAAVEAGASTAFASLIVALVGVVALLTTVSAGQLIDRLGDRRAMALATAWAAVSIGGTVVALVGEARWSLGLFVLSAVLRAPAVNVWNLARQALVADTMPTEQLGRAMTALGGTMRVGSLVGPLCGALLLLRLPLWSVYVFSLVCALLSLAILYSPRGATLEGHRHPVVPQEDGDAGAPASGRGIRSLQVRWPAVILAGAAISALSLVRVSHPVVLQVWGVHLGLTASTISLLVALIATIELVLMFPGGYLKDRLGRAPVLIACLTLLGASFVLMPLLPNVPGLVGAVVVAAVGNGLGAGINMTIGADLSPPVGRGRFLGVWAVFSNVGVVAGPGLVAAVLVVASVQAALLGIAAVALGGALWMAAWARTVDLPRGTGRGIPSGP
ncbi:MFS transporter [Ornithinimicrobium tianjinense]|uniref:MFS transporter n=1 Tax=Ornithinimicrobium tianjinense TaxID=1195761 RepID=A0A917BFT8_9MICO|nr:MFS transporter [Ornithinimicrobium tianjinense]GGF36874.1 MFS transporter [Ornithinimicrobium tianjinense]